MVKNTKSDIDDYYPYIDNDSIDLTFGEGLLSVFNKGKKSDFYIRLNNVRRRIAQEWGVVIPLIRIRDDTSLELYEYVIKIQSIIVFRFTFSKNRLFCLSENPDIFKNMPGCEEFTEPIFGLKGLWITKQKRKKAEMNGIKVYSNAKVIAVHLSLSIIPNLGAIISCDKISKLIDNIRKDAPILINEIEHNEIRISHITLIARNLLSNQIPLTNFIQILELINEAWLINKDIHHVSSYVQSRLSKKISTSNEFTEKNSTHLKLKDIAEMKHHFFEVAVIDSTFCGIILGYDISTMDAPQIMMKRSRDGIYELIISAINANIPFVNNSDIAQTIFRSYEEGDEIEKEMYQKVALLYTELLSRKQRWMHGIN